MTAKGEERVPGRGDSMCKAYMGKGKWLVERTKKGPKYVKHREKGIWFREEVGRA